jgi:UDP-N-acetylglucosamine:LPS N-acetylglucosamine transferase
VDYLEIERNDFSEKPVAIIAPLDWGLGHAARCVPIIEELIRRNYHVIVAGSGFSLEMLKAEFPRLIFESIDTAAFTYSKRNALVWKLFLQIPKFFKNSYKEKQVAQKLAAKYKPSLLISDNRYGFRSKCCRTIFITHQISPRLPAAWRIFQALVRRLHLGMIRPFSLCLIPDFEGSPNLSGSLSHGFSLSEKFRFIGPLSRFSDIPKTRKRKASGRILIIISGPEPQRSIFYEKVLAQTRDLQKEILLVAGRPGSVFEQSNNNLRIVSHLTRNEMADAVGRAEYVICRAGYSSIMDLFVMQKKAVLIPTAGQTEQEYLAEHLSETGMFLFRKQNSFSLKEIDNAVSDFEPAFNFGH